MTGRARRRAKGERGAALIAVLLVTAILVVLGFSLLLMAQRESGIAANQTNGAIALYAAEAGARLAIHWFDDPASACFSLPASAEVDRTRRLVAVAGDASGRRRPAVAGDPGRPLYKDQALTASAIFDRPYGPAATEAFLGIETGTDPDAVLAAYGPDLIVLPPYLATINAALLEGVAPPGASVRITRIEIFAPPGAGRFAGATGAGIATIKVVAGVFVHPGTADERCAATRSLRVVIDRIPIPVSLGPLQSCSRLSHGQLTEVRWGTEAASEDITLTAGSLDHAPTGLPYASDMPPVYIHGAETLASWAALHSGEAIEDPWFLLVAGRSLTAAPSGARQPWPFAWPGSVMEDHSNMFQGTAGGCPVFDYEAWKAIAQNGSRGAFYYAYRDGGFHLDGTGTGVSFEAATAGRSGIMFFDTVDGAEPSPLPYDDPDSNLTPGVVVEGGSWATRGLIYLNARSLEVRGGGAGVQRTLLPPGEPGDESGFVNLDYPGSIDGAYSIRQGIVSFKSFQDPETGAWWCTDAFRCDQESRAPALAPVRDRYGLPFRAAVSLDGVIHTSGAFMATGAARFHGALVARQEILDGGGSPGFFFDPALASGEWPRRGMDLPRVIVRSWQPGPSPNGSPPPEP
jgi:hypothetical protein